MRLDEEKLEALRSWGEKLREASGEESAAVGRAILMLVEEIDRLHVELWHARLRASARESDAADATVHEDEQPVPVTLHTRLQRALRHDSNPEPSAPAEHAGSTTDDVEATGAQGWIDALRRQE
jgi:hypothetical protein